MTTYSKPLKAKSSTATAGDSDDSGSSLPETTNCNRNSLPAIARPIGMGSGDSVINFEGSSSAESGDNSSSADDRDLGPAGLAAKETRNVNRSKCLVFLVLAIFATVVGYLTYKLTTEEELQTFESSVRRCCGFSSVQSSLSSFSHSHSWFYSSVVSYHITVYGFFFGNH